MLREELFCSSDGRLFQRIIVNFVLSAESTKYDIIIIMIIIFIIKIVALDLRV